ncbi:CBS and ACT domain-containing protein [Brevibacillus humidisoli]|uniref:CBS and ACT domain-containing protein n=1 Tax=Brevibacillus humidisoli TaxID=2895522 RepID=UPI001E39EFA1|nr:CBS and ACT domain-containing protein [Brevibacillus humidisoli]UFJ41556.1 CBS and ACT domain-containing protein [Brevibacillus humidisoli]
MRIEEMMRVQVITVGTTTTIGEALSLLRENRIRHLPVMEQEKLVGIVSDRDLRDALPSTLTRHDDDREVLQKQVKDIMRTDVITAHPLDFIEDAAKTVYEYKIGSLPVVEDGQLVGIVTESDLLHRLIELFGVHRPSSRIEVEVDDRAGMLAEVSQVFREAQVNVSSVVVYPCTSPGKKKLVFRVQTIDPRGIEELLLARGFAVIGPLEGGTAS